MMNNNSFDQEKFEKEVKQVKRFIMSTTYGFVNAETYYEYAIRKTEQTPLMSFVDLMYTGLDHMNYTAGGKTPWEEKDKNIIIKIILDTFTIFKDVEDLNATEFADKYGVLIDGNNGDKIRQSYTMEYIRKAGYAASAEGLKYYLHTGRDEDYEKYMKMREDFWNKHFFPNPYSYNPVGNPYPIDRLLF